jgi:hypothetical protein
MTRRVRRGKDEEETKKRARRDQEETRKTRKRPRRDIKKRCGEVDACGAQKLEKMRRE